MQPPVIRIVHGSNRALRRHANPKPCGPTRAVRILLADDQAAVLDLLNSFFLRSKRFKVVGAVTDGARAIHRAKKDRPDIILVDLFMSRQVGIKTTEQIIRECPWAKVIAFSGSEEGDLVSALLRAGARGYVSKGSCSRELLRGIESVQRGEIFISQSVLRRIALHDTNHKSNVGPVPENGLSNSEVQVVGGLAEGLGSKQIAARMKMSVRTIEKYRELIKVKLRIRSVAEITKFAIRSGITQLE